jgi:hypothetical protein
LRRRSTTRLRLGRRRSTQGRYGSQAGSSRAIRPATDRSARSCARLGDNESPVPRPNVVRSCDSERLVRTFFTHSRGGASRRKPAGSASAPLPQARPAIMKSSVTVRIQLRGCQQSVTGRTPNRRTATASSARAPTRAPDESAFSCNARPP